MHHRSDKNHTIEKLCSIEKFVELLCLIYEQPTTLPTVARPWQQFLRAAKLLPKYCVLLAKLTRAGREAKAFFEGMRDDFQYLKGISEAEYEEILAQL